MKKWVMPLLAAVVVSGCSSTMEEKFIDADNAGAQVNIAGAMPLPNKEAMRTVSLVRLIHDMTPDTVCRPDRRLKEDKDILENEDHLGKAYADFLSCTSISGLSEGRTRRNNIQAAIMAVADRRCEVYKRHISLIDSNASFFSGAIATTAGVLSGLFNSAEVARSLGATAGIASGVGAEFNKAFFKEQLVPVIISGINIKRGQIHGEIATKRPLALDDYPLPLAIADAARYAGSCSVTEGLDQVKDSIAKAGVVGIDVAASVIRDSRRVQEELEILSAPAKDRTQLVRDIEARRLAEGASGPQTASRLTINTSTLGETANLEQRRIDLVREQAQMNIELVALNADLAKAKKGAEPTNPPKSKDEQEKANARVKSAQIAVDQVTEKINAIAKDIELTVFELGVAKKREDALKKRRDDVKAKLEALATAKDDAAKKANDGKLKRVVQHLFKTSAELPSSDEDKAKLRKGVIDYIQSISDIELYGVEVALGD